MKSRGQVLPLQFYENNRKLTGTNHVAKVITFIVFSIFCFDESQLDAVTSFTLGPTIRRYAKSNFDDLHFIWNPFLDSVKGSSWFLLSRNNKFSKSRCATILEVASVSSASPHENHRPQYSSSGSVSQQNSIHDTSQSLSTQSVTSRRTQMRWIAQSVQKLLNEEPIKQQRDIAYYNKCCDELVDGLILLSTARTKSHVLAAGRKLETLLENGFLYEQGSLDVLERVVKSAAMAGLLQPIAFNITDHMINHRLHVPSKICQDSIFSSLRQAGRVAKMEMLLYNFGDLIKLLKSHYGKDSLRSEPCEGISLVSFNIYLAALCDSVTNSRRSSVDRYGGSVANNSTASKTTAGFSKTEALDRAWNWIKSGDSHRDVSAAEQYFGVTPDAVSYATVIQAAAGIGNQSLVETIWLDLQKCRIEPNIVAYNARLRIQNEIKDVALPTIDRDRSMLQIWNEITDKKSRVHPDRYSIDFILLPLIRAGRISEVERVIDNFVQRSSENVASEAFAAFLLTLVDGGHLVIAQQLLETYVLPSLSPVIVRSSGYMRIVRPSVRHFNALLEGYRQKMASIRTSSLDINQNTTIDVTLEETVIQPAMTLYNVMSQSSVVPPDRYTITTMMGLCRNATELSTLLYSAVADFRIDLRSVVLRAALTAFGDLGDPSSTLWIFIHFSSKSTRTWNVFLGALAEAAKISGANTLQPSMSEAAKCFSTKEVGKTSMKPILTLLEHCTIVDSVRILLETMSSNSSYLGIDAPPANSQTFCIAAAALQYNAIDSSTAINLFRSATKQDIPADGRFVNAIFRCYGHDINAALRDWKNEIRPRCISYEQRRQSKGDNLSPAYHGLLYVCGRALRPDIALRIVYAMNKEGLEPTELSLNSYKSGKRTQHNNKSATIPVVARVAQKLQLIGAYESLLEVECAKYDRNDRRRHGEKRVRIIL